MGERSALSALMPHSGSPCTRVLQAQRSGLELLERLGRLAPASYLDLCCYPRRAKILLFLRLSAGFFLVVAPDGIRLSMTFDFRPPRIKGQDN